MLELAGSKTLIRPWLEKLIESLHAPLIRLLMRALI